LRHFLAQTVKNQDWAYKVNHSRQMHMAKRTTDTSSSGLLSVCRKFKENQRK